MNATNIRTRPAALVGLLATALLLVGCGTDAADDADTAADHEQTTGVSSTAPGVDDPAPADPAAEPQQDAVPPPAGMCAAELNFRGITYTMTGQQLYEGKGRSLGEATVPPCNDTPGVGQDDDAINVVEVFRIPGLPADKAIFSGGSVWTAAP